MKPVIMNGLVANAFEIMADVERLDRLKNEGFVDRTSSNARCFSQVFRMRTRPASSTIWASTTPGRTLKFETLMSPLSTASTASRLQSGQRIWSISEHPSAARIAPSFSALGQEPMSAWPAPARENIRYRLRETPSCIRGTREQGDADFVRSTHSDTPFHTPGGLRMGDEATMDDFRPRRKTLE